MTLNDQGNISVTCLTACLCACSLVIFPSLLDLSLNPRLIILSITLALFLVWAIKKKISIGFQGNIFTVAYFGLVLWSCFSIAWSQNKAEAVYDSAKWLAGYGVFAVSTFLLNKWPTHFKRALFVTSLSISFILFTVVTTQAVKLSSYNHETIYAVTGLNGHKNLLSSFLFLMLFFVIGQFDSSLKYAKPLAIIVVLLNVGMIIFLQTKAVWLAMLVFALLSSISFLFRKKNPASNKRMAMQLAIGMLVANIFFLLVLPSLCERFVTKQIHLPAQLDKILDVERLVVWHKTNQLINAHPFIGLGSGNWQVYFPSTTLSGIWRAEDLQVSFQRPHNDFLWILSENGLLGFNLFLLFLIGIIVYGYRQATFTSNARGYHPNMAIVLISYMVIAFFDFPKERAEHLLWWNILLALVYHQSQKNYSLKSFILINPKRALTLLFPSIILIFVFASRCKGEYYTRQMYDAKTTNNWAGLIDKGNKAKSFVYTLDPTSVPIDWYIGNAYSSLQNYGMAQQSFMAAYHDHPYQRNVLNDLASAYVMQGKVDAAIPLYNEASRISPRFDEPKLNLAAIYLNQKNITMAKQCLDSLYHDSEKRSRYLNILKILENGQQ